MIAVVRTGRNPTMRHIASVHGVCIKSMHDQFTSPSVAMSYISTMQMAADIYTKEFTDGDKWLTLCRQIGLYSLDDIQSGDMLPLFLSQLELRSEKRGEHSIYEATAITSVILEELHGLRTALCVHDNDDGTQHAIVKEPRLYRFPRNAKHLNRRSTWIKKTMNGPKLQTEQTGQIVLTRSLMTGQKRLSSIFGKSRRTNPHKQHVPSYKHTTTRMST